MMYQETSGCLTRYFVYLWYITQESFHLETQ